MGSHLANQGVTPYCDPILPNAEEVRSLARRHGLAAKPIPMKNTHHATMTELVIGRDLDWMSGINRVLESQAEYKVKRRMNTQ